MYIWYLGIHVRVVWLWLVSIKCSLQPCLLCCALSTTSICSCMQCMSREEPLAHSKCTSLQVHRKTWKDPAQCCRDVHACVIQCKGLAYSCMALSGPPQMVGPGISEPLEDCSRSIFSHASRSLQGPSTMGGIC